jgi:hypothetical protein
MINRYRNAMTLHVKQVITVRNYMINRSCNVRKLHVKQVMYC